MTESLKLFLGHGAAGNPPRNALKGQPQTPKTRVTGSGLIEACVVPTRTCHAMCPKGGPQTPETGSLRAIRMRRVLYPHAQVAEEAQAAAADAEQEVAAVQALLFAKQGEWGL